MKIGIYKTFLFSLLSLSFFACEKEEDRAVLQTNSAPELSVSESALILDEERAGEEAVSFSWTAADYGFPAGVDYTLELAPEGTSFAEPKEVELENLREQVYTVEEFNNLLIKMGLEPDQEAQLEARVKAVIADAVEPLYSNTAIISVTPYSNVVEPVYVYAPGAYQGWDPATAAALASVEDDGIYTGYITFPNAESLEFKITEARSWDVNWGDEGDGTLVANGPNLKVAEPGSYLIKVDLNEMSWSATPYSWGLIGDATGSWETDQDLVYDHQEGVWTITTELSQGAVKFRLNDDWGMNYGDSNTSDPALDRDGDNIAIAEAGTYEIILDLSDPENPVYAIEKQ